MVPIIRGAIHMSASFSASTARNIFFGGTAFFLLLFLGLTYNTPQQLPQRDQRAQLSNPQIAAGKKLWEDNNCIGCHTLLGEGAYFAPELGNVTTRWGVYDDPEAAFETMKGWMEAQPSGMEGRRQMPNFALSDEEIRGLSEFLRWSDHMDTQGWPPNDAV